VSEPRFHAPAADADVRTVSLDADDAHHLIRVLRLGPGAPVRVFNGRGGEWRARVADVHRASVRLELGDPVPTAPEPPVAVTVALAVLKGDQMDTAIRDATALGAYAIVPIVSDRVTVPSRAWNSGRAVDRWRRIAVQSARQSGRAFVPDVTPVRAFDDVVAGAAAGAILVATEPSVTGSIEASGLDHRPATALALVGPEGGWSPREIGALRDLGAHAVRLGPRTLRAELAPTVLLTALWMRWGWQ
jgi:16S rRNA (uracil1498-N3)-methyltransferase